MSRALRSERWPSEVRWAPADLVSHRTTMAEDNGITDV
jgi:hypothetical protein